MENSCLPFSPWTVSGAEGSGSACSGSPHAPPMGRAPDTGRQDPGREALEREG